MTQTERVIEEVLAESKIATLNCKCGNRGFEFIRCHFCFDFANITAANNATRLARALKCAVESLKDHRLGHEHAPNLSHTRAMGDSYGWCDYCSTKVPWGPSEADIALKDIDRIMSGEILEHANKGEGE